MLSEYRSADSNPLERRIFPVLVIAGLALRLALAWAPLEFQLRYLLPDDAFYYFAIARNAASGLGLTFDTISETNGFHPLWMLILAILSYTLGPALSVISPALSVAAFLDTLSLLLLRRILERLHIGSAVRLLTLFVYAFSSVLLSHAGPLNGMETALATVLLFAFLNLYIRIRQEQDIMPGMVTGFGVVAGLLLLARTDSVIIVAFCVVSLFFTTPARRLSLLASLVAGVCIAPWIFWSFIRFGTIVQTSAYSVAYMTKFHLQESGWTTADTAVQVIKNLAHINDFFPVYLGQTSLSSPVSILVLAGSAILISGAWRAIASRRASFDKLIRFRMMVLLVPVLSVLAFVLVHTFRAVYMRSWYYGLLLPVLFPVAACLVDFSVRAARNHKGILVLVTGIIFLQLTAGMILCLQPSVGEMDKYRMVASMNNSLRDGVRVGSWNAGLYGYFFEKGIVVGLDGLVNNEAGRHIKEHTLGDFIETQKLDYLVDPKGAMEYALPFIGRGGDIFEKTGVLLVVPGENGQAKTILVENPLR